MGIIPGGKNGLAKRTIASMDESAARLVVVFTFLCTLVGVAVTAGDFIASARGWGTWVAGTIGEDQLFQLMAYVVSGAPQLIQITLSLLFMADIGFFNWITGPMYGVLFVLDTFLDYTYLTSTGSTPLTALIIVIGVFFFLSEVSIGVFWPLTMALAKEARKQNKGFRGQPSGRPMPSMAMPGASPGPRGPGPSSGPRGARTQAGRRNAGR